MTPIENLHGPEIPASLLAQRQALSRQIPDAANANALAAAENPRILESNLGQRMRRIAGRILEQAQANRTLEQDTNVAALRRELNADRRADIANMQRDRIDEVIEGLSMRSLGPTTTVDRMLRDEPDTSNERYIQARAHTGRDGQIDLVYWSTNPSRMNADRQLLIGWRDQTVQNLSTSARAGLNALILRLDALEQADPTRLQADLVSRQISESMTSKGMNYMGRMTLIVAGTGLVVLNGAMMLVNGNFSPIIGLYAAVALAAAYPNMFFGSREQRALEAAGAAFQTPAFKFFQGRLPAAAMGVLTENIMSEEGRRAVTETIRRDDPTPLTAAEVTRLAAELLPATNQRVPAEARSALEAAIREQPQMLLNLATSLQPSAGNDDGRQLVIDGARLGEPRQSLIRNGAQEIRDTPGAAQALRQPPTSASSPA